MGNGLRLAGVFACGIVISFIGSLPLGTVNVATFQLSITKGFQVALLFACGSMIAEAIYVRLSLSLMDRILKQKMFLKLLQWISVALMLALAAISFMAASGDEPPAENIILSKSIHPFIAGFLMMGINPVQIPFWGAWSTILFQKKIMATKPLHYFIFTLGVATGSMSASLVFIYSGIFLAENTRGNLNGVNWIVGGVFLIIAMIQLYRIIFTSDKVNHPN